MKTKFWCLLEENDKHTSFPSFDHVNTGTFPKAWRATLKNYLKTKQNKKKLSLDVETN